ncbi:MAG TPA: hypothetical protein VEX67_10215 [Solirubrobacteraceae bacterium]|nr:hypothetical protein [Solirubrobacteraceae bacterium]
MNGAGLRKVTLPPKRTAEDNEVQWSPDGRKLVFVRTFYDGHDNAFRQAIHTVNADGSGLRQVTDVRDGTTLYSASFSPDGKRITVAMQGVGGAADIYTMNTDSTAITPVTRTEARDSAPDWGGAG